MKENTKKRWPWHIVLLTVLLMLFSILCWLGFARSVMGSIVSRTSPAEAVETAKAPAADSASSPAVQASGNKLSRVLSKVDTLTDAVDTRWYNNMFKKSSFSRMDSLYTYCLTGEIASSQVMRGKDDWLFYKSATDGDTIADYEGTNLYTAEEMDALCDFTLNIQNKMEARGIRFALLFPPNKENLYARYMPDDYIQSPVNRTEELTRKLQESGVNAIFPFDVLQKESEDFRLYYSNDTHWNLLGAYIGSREVLASWGIEVPELAARSITSYPLKGNYRYGANADLTRISGITFSFDGEYEYVIDGMIDIDWEKLGEEQEAGGISHFRNDDARLDATLFLVGDSFRTSMIPALAEIFSDIHVIHRSNYTNEMLDEIDPDYMIVQLVERYSDDVRFMTVPA